MLSLDSVRKKFDVEIGSTLLSKFKKLSFDILSLDIYLETGNKIKDKKFIIVDEKKIRFGSVKAKFPHKFESIKSMEQVSALLDYDDYQSCDIKNILNLKSEISIKFHEFVV